MDNSESNDKNKNINDTTQSIPEYSPGSQNKDNRSQQNYKTNGIVENNYHQSNRYDNRNRNRGNNYNQDNNNRQNYRMTENNNYQSNSNRYDNRNKNRGNNYNQDNNNRQNYRMTENNNYQSNSNRYDNRNKNRGNNQNNFRDRGERKYRLFDNFRTNPKIIEAIEEAYEDIINRINSKVKEYATLGKTEARVFDFCFKDEVKMKDQYLLDLLSKTDLINRMQIWLDENHSDTDENNKQIRRFMIYYNRIGQHKTKKIDEKYGIFVSWKIDDWDKIEQINSRNIKLSGS